MRFDLIHIRNNHLYFFYFTITPIVIRNIKKQRCCSQERYFTKDEPHPGGNTHTYYPIQWLFKIFRQSRYFLFQFWFSPSYSLTVLRKEMQEDIIHRLQQYLYISICQIYVVCRIIGY